MTTVLFDHPTIRENLLPFTYTRPVSEIRCGILSISDKWKRYTKSEIRWHTQGYLQFKYPGYSLDTELVFINGAVIPSKQLYEAINALSPKQVLVKDEMIIAWNNAPEFVDYLSDGFPADLIRVQYDDELSIIENTWNIFEFNGDQIRQDFDFFISGSSEKINDPFTQVYNAENVFVEKGAVIRAAILNAENGPIYIGKNAKINEGAIINGPFALCEEASVNMGTKVRGDTTVGPHSKIGGEVSNTVIFSYSNKSHDGFLGNSVLGEWCNIGAGTNSSNLKNNYQSIKLWNYPDNRFIETGKQFCGLMMGDHAKCGINTMFNTGTVVGVGANVFGEGFLRNFIPSFSWGGTVRGYSTFRIDRFYDMTEKVMQRRNIEFDSIEREILKHVFETSSIHRHWER